MSWIAVGGLAISAAGTAYNIYQSDQAKEKAQSQLDAVNKTAVPQYSESPALSQAHGAAIQDYFNPQGISSTQRGVFSNNLATNSNTQLHNAVSRSGGQLSPFLQGVENASNVGAINNFANTDATIQAQNRNNAAGRMDATAGQIQNINDRNTQAALQRRMMIEQALGSAIAQQKQNQSQAITGFGNTATTLAGYKAAGMIGKGGNTGSVDNPYAARTDEYGTYTPATSFGATDKASFDWQNPFGGGPVYDEDSPPPTDG